MADPRFFNRSAPKTLSDLAALSGAVVAAGADPDQLIEDVAPLDQAGAGQISFLDNVRYRDAFKATKAAACVIAADMAVHAPANTALLISARPYKSYALIAQAFYPEVIPAASVAPGAVIDATARIGAGCVIESGVVIGPGAQLGDRCWVEANAVIGANVIIGSHCRIGACASVTHAVLGDHVRLYPGCRVGQDGFGFAIDPAGHVKVPQLGRVIIEDHAEIGANTTIDRGAGPDTVIGQGTWIDNLVQIGHNVRIGKGCVIVSQAGISGSTVLEDYVMLGGQAGVTGHLHIGKGARIGAQSGVMRDVPAGEQVIGAPALPSRQFMRQISILNSLANAKKEK